MAQFAGNSLDLDGLVYRKDRHGLVVNSDGYSWLPDGSVDFLLTDPPFNIAQKTNFHTYEKNTINSYKFDADAAHDWDSHDHQDFVTLMGEWASEFNRVLRKGGTFAVFCADKYVSHLMEQMEAHGLSPKRVLTWRKPNAVPVNRKSLMMSACEYVVVGKKDGKPSTFNADIGLRDKGFEKIESVLVGDKVGSIVEKAVRDAVSAVSTRGKGREAAVVAAVEAAVESATKTALQRVSNMYVVEDGGYFRACVPNYIESNSKAGNRLHPTEKPTEVLEFLVQLLSKKGDLILDPFGGSGSTGEAAKANNRKFVIVEREQEFYSKLQNRLF